MILLCVFDILRFQYKIIWQCTEYCLIPNLWMTVIKIREIEVVRYVILVSVVIYEKLQCGNIKAAQIFSIKRSFALLRTILVSDKTQICSIKISFALFCTICVSDKT